LLPGEQFSFNGTVGRRTLKAGFKLAGVYKNGQHDTGLGGGICQVSTTLYNSALLADLPIRRRSNHSLPVPYVPLGQDATVDYGNLDLVFENSYPTPIAISSYYEPGRLTFRVLGQKQPGLSVKITRSRMEAHAAEVEHVRDPTLPAGVKRVVKPGSTYRRVATFRLVYMNGKLVKKEPLGHSIYGGMPRVVAVGTRLASPAGSPSVGAPVVPTVATPSRVPPSAGSATQTGG
jgi:vancomycin resistance protein YoaR